MRGKLITFVKICKFSGITPAHAGKTVKADLFQLFTEDHPRACGENTKGTRDYSTQEGSPPRMRGKRFLNHVSLLGNRITPAHAGKTSERNERK